MAHPHAEHRAHHVAKAHALIAKTGHHSLKHRVRGGGVHEDEAEDRVMIERGVHEHESAMHKGEPKTKLKLRHGGHVDGKHGKHHLAKRARGGGLKGGGKHTKVNVIVAPQGGGGQGDAMMAHRAGMQQGLQAGAALGARAAAQRMAGAGAAPAMGAGPPAAPGAGPAVGPRPGMGVAPGAGGMGLMRKRGGHVPRMEAGAGSGEGRIEKTREYGEGGFEPKDRMPHVVGKRASGAPKVRGR